MIEGAELVIWGEDGESSSMDLSLLELTVMLKAIGYNQEDNSIFGPDTLNRILRGEVNPFVLKRVEE